MASHRERLRLSGLNESPEEVVEDWKTHSRPSSGRSRVEPHERGRLGLLDHTPDHTTGFNMGHITPTTDQLAGFNMGQFSPTVDQPGRYERSKFSPPTADQSTSYETSQFSPTADQSTRVYRSRFSPTADQSTSYERSQFSPTADQSTRYERSQFSPTADQSNRFNRSRFSPTADHSTIFDRSRFSPTANQSTRYERSQISPTADQSARLDMGQFKPGAYQTTGLHRGQSEPRKEKTPDIFESHRKFLDTIAKIDLIAPGLLCPSFTRPDVTHETINGDIYCATQETDKQEVVDGRIVTKKTTTIRYIQPRVYNTLLAGKIIKTTNSDVLLGKYVDEYIMDSSPEIKDPYHSKNVETQTSVDEFEQTLTDGTWMKKKTTMIVAQISREDDTNKDALLDDKFMDQSEAFDSAGSQPIFNSDAQAHEHNSNVQCNDAHSAIGDIIEVIQLNDRKVEESASDIDSTPEPSSVSEPRISNPAQVGSPDLPDKISKNEAIDTTPPTIETVALSSDDMVPLALSSNTRSVETISSETKLDTVIGAETTEVRNSINPPSNVLESEKANVSTEGTEVGGVGLNNIDN